MKIVHVVRQYKPMIGGLEDVVEQLCLQLARSGSHQTRVVTLDRLFTEKSQKLPARELIAGIEVQRLPWTGSRRYPLAPSVLAAIADADIVHVHAIDFFFDFLAMTRWLHGKPLVASTHGGFFHSSFASTLKRVFFQTVTRFSARSYFAICASSENDATRFQQIAGESVRLIENGVDIEKWRDASAKTPRRNMIFVGRWSANKRIEALFRLLASLRRLHPDWRLTVAGAPFDLDRARLGALAAEAGVLDHVTIAEGPSVAEVGRLVGESSFIVSASEYEGFGISLIEGLSAGLYPVVSDIAPFQKVIDNLEMGIATSFADTDSLAAKVEAAFANAVGPEQRQACMAFAQRYGWTFVVKQYEKVYEEALANSAPRYLSGKLPSSTSRGRDFSPSPALGPSSKSGRQH